MARALGAFCGFFFGKQIVVGHTVFAGRCFHAARQSLELELADVAAAAFGERKFEWLRHVRGQRRQVLGDELLLQRHRCGRNQYARATRNGHGNRGNAVGQRFAHARAGLHHGDGALRRGGVVIVLIHLAQLRETEGVRNLFSHAPLTGAAAKTCCGLNHRIERLQGLGGPILCRHRGRDLRVKNKTRTGMESSRARAQWYCAFIQHFSRDGFTG